MAAPINPPKSMGPAARRLWRAVLSEFELEEHERTLLLQAAGSLMCAPSCRQRWTLKAH
jgi:hypothetical protein